jgi:hypothetical protein
MPLRCTVEVTYPVPCYGTVLTNILASYEEAARQIRKLDETIRSAMRALTAMGVDGLL